MEGSLPNFETEATKFNEEIGERMVHNNHQTEEELKQDHQVYIKDYLFSTKYWSHTMNYYRICLNSWSTLLT